MVRITTNRFVSNQIKLKLLLDLYLKTLNNLMPTLPSQPLSLNPMLTSSEIGSGGIELCHVFHYKLQIGVTSVVVSLSS